MAELKIYLRDKAIAIQPSWGQINAHLKNYAILEI